MVVPAAFSAKSLTCVRSLGSKGVHTIIASEDPTVPASASRYCDEVVHVPSPHEDLLDYKDALVSLVSRPDVRAIIPNRESDTFVLSKHREEFDAHVPPLWPNFETISTVHDGLQLADVVDDLGVPVPETRLYDDVDDWGRRLIVKARYSILTSDYDDVLGPGECEPRLGQVHVRPGVEPDRDEVMTRMKGHVPIVQEYVPIRHEYSFRALYDHGEPVATSVRRQLRGETYAGGVSVYKQLVRNPTIERYGRTVLDELDWHGLATVQFIEDEETGEFAFLEVNPRTWTSIPCDVMAGADYPYFYWLLACGLGDRIDPVHEVGFASHQLFGELQYLRSVLFDDIPNADRPRFPAALAEVVSSIYRQPNFDFLSLDDPLPFVRGLRNAVRG